MKRIALIVATFFFALAFVTCDKVTNPILVKNTTKLTDTIIRTNVGSATLNVRKVLLEDYTGHFCGNCPRAARRAEGLLGVYGDSLVIIANHVTPVYAAPQSDTLYKEDFRNDVSNEWDATLQISAAPGLPRGSINRTIPYAIGDAAWAASVDAAVKQPQSAKMELTTYYDSTHHALSVKVKTTFLKAFTTDVMLVVALTQDGLIADQKDYSVPSGAAVIYDDVRPDYVFNHMVFGSVNGTWGQLVKASPAVNDTATVMNSNYTLQKCFYQSSVCIDPKHVNVVAFIYRKDTKEVLQVETLGIINHAAN